MNNKKLEHIENYKGQSIMIYRIGGWRQIYVGNKCYGDDIKSAKRDIGHIWSNLNKKNAKHDSMIDNRVATEGYPISEARYTCWECSHSIDGDECKLPECNFTDAYAYRKEI